MKIKTKLYIGAAVSIILISILVFLLFHFSSELGNELNKAELAEEIAQENTELAIITEEYLKYHYTRMEQQWESKFNSIMGLMEEADELIILDEIYTDLKSLNNSFSQLKANYEESEKLLEENSSQEEVGRTIIFEDRLAARMRLDSARILSNAFEIAAESRKEAIAIKQRARLVISGFGIILIFIIGITAFFVVQNITKPIEKLVRGTKIIGRGNLDHKIDIESGDEAGQLSRAFNEMIVKVKERTEKLKDEITERKRAEEALRKSEKKFRLTFENAKDAIFWADPETGLITECNKAAETLIEKKKDEIIGKHQTMVHPPKKVEYYANMFKKHIEQKEAVDDEAEVITKSGKVKPVHITASVTLVGGKLVIQGIFRDIAESKKVEEALKESEEKFRNLAEHSPNMIFINKKGRIVYVNKKCEEIMGYKRKEFYPLDFDFFTLIAPEYIELIKANLRRHMMGEEIAPYECGLITKEGKRIDSIITTKLITYEGELAIIGTATDITERKRAEELLKDSEEKYRQLFSTVSDAIIVTDAETKQILDVNNAAESLYGYTRDEFLKLQITEVSAEHKKTLHSIQQVIKGNITQPYTQYHIKKDGTSFPIEISSNVFILKNRSIVVKAIRDITERVKKEDEVRQQIMKFRLENGNVYLAEEPYPIKSISAFSDLITVGYSGVVIARTPKSQFEKQIPIGNVEFWWVSEKKRKKTILPDFAEIEKLIDEMLPKTAVFIERLDYLLSKNTFKGTLSFVHHLRECAYLENHIIILSIDPSTLSNREYNMLKKETRDIEAKTFELLSEDFIEILKFIYQKNINGLKPSYIEVGQRVCASKPTVRKRIRKLITGGYVVENSNGRCKVVELTEKGRHILSL